jgi:hypothetical protein
LGAVAAAVVDSRNIFHQAGAAIGVRVRPTVPGVRAALSRLDFQIKAVHVGLALARERDQVDLAAPHRANLAYQRRVLADGGEVLLGELHRKPGGAVEEKMVDGACCVRIARYVDEIVFKRTDIQAIVVLSQDIDLKPAIDYAVDMKVPIFAAAPDVVQHRSHPFILMGPQAYAEMTGTRDAAHGHGLRELLVRALQDQKRMPWRVTQAAGRLLLRHASGLTAVPARGVTLGAVGAFEYLYPVDVTWESRILGTFPLLVCDSAPPQVKCWDEHLVRRRTAPMTVEVVQEGGGRRREHYPLGGIIPGDRVLVHRETGRVLGRLAAQGDHPFDPDTPRILRVTTCLPAGGVLAVDPSGSRGLLNTFQVLTPGQRIPAVQIDQKKHRPVWAAIGTPLP